ncbi:MAG: hypothetical protein FJW39_06725 [Acidobacteria bacterium]|nr:hypothetical protein [Acidobacteriota bacterium]
MPGYLDGYGESDARREKTLKRIAVAVGAVLVVGLAGYFLLRNHREKGQVDAFLNHIRAKQFEQAYALFGCTQASPCRDYPFDKFLQDWGPQSNHPDPGTIKLAALKSCDGGIIQFVNWGNDEIRLWVNRADLTLSYAPWPICNPRMKVQ